MSWSPSAEVILATAVVVAEDLRLDDFAHVDFDTFVDEVCARVATFDEEAHPRDERGRFGTKDGDSERRDTKFTSAKDVSFEDWARQFPRGTVFRAGTPGRLEAMRNGADLGTPEAEPHPEQPGLERIKGVWVSDSAKPEYLDTGEVMAAFNVRGLERINEGAPGDFLVTHIPADRLLGIWTPGTGKDRGYEPAPYHSRGRGFEGIRPENRRVAAAFDEEAHPRDERGRFGEKGGEDVAPLVFARQRQPEDTKPKSKPARDTEILTMADLSKGERERVLEKVEGPVPPVKPPEGWPKDADGKAIVPQPPEGKEWGLGVSAEGVRENYESMFERANANPEIREAGMQWYDNTRTQVDELGNRYGYDLEQGATAIAAMSAGTRWETEFPILETMMRMDGTTLDVSQERLDAINAKLDKLGEDHIENGTNLSDMNSAQAVQVMFNEHMTQPSDPDRIYDTEQGWGARYSFNQYERALEAIRGEMPPEQMSGVKVREFYNNITNPEVDGHVTIDVMMMRIAANNPAIQNDTRITSSPSITTVSLGPSPFLADEVRRIAEREGMTANDVQAMMWVQWLADEKAAGRGGARGGAEL